MKKLASLAMFATMAMALLIPMQSASAGYNNDKEDRLYDECDYSAVWEALDNGADLVFVSNYSNYYGGDNGDQVIIGTDDDDVIHGGSGNDVICGGEGDDDIYGGSGNDILIGGEDWNDDLYGESGRDTLIDRSADECDGGTGNDTSYADCDDYSSIENW